MPVIIGLWAALAATMQGAAQTAPLTPTPPSTYEQGVAARHAGDAAGSAVLLQRAVREAPGSADALVQYGYALLALGRLREADQAFSEAVRIAPTYDDARVGRALAAERLGAIDRARALVAPVSATHSEANALRQRIAFAGADQRWALDFDASATRLRSGQTNWRQLDAQLAHRLRSGARLAGRIEAARRFERNDIYGELRGEWPVGRGDSIHLLVGGTPSADFRPRWQIGAGGRVRINERAAPTVLMLDVRRAHYRSGGTTLFNPGIEQYLAGGRVWVTLQSVNLVSDRKLVMGASGRLDVLATDRLRLFGGAADAPDVDQRILSRTRSLFAGAAIDVSPMMKFRISVSGDRPSIGADRTGFSLGATVRF